MGRSLPGPLPTEWSQPYNSIRFGRSAPIAAVHALLLRNAAFAALPLDDRQALMNIAAQRDLRRGEYLWRQGEASGSVCVVLCGLLEDFELDANQHRGATRVVSAGSWFGALTSLIGEKRRANVMALGPAKLLELPGPPLKALLRARPDLYPYFIRLIAQSVDDALIQVRARALKGEQRLYRLLLHLCAAQEAISPQATHNFPLSQQVLGDATGLTRIRVAQLMAALRAQGIVGTSYAGVEVLDLPRLKALAAPSRLPTEIH